MWPRPSWGGPWKTLQRGSSLVTVEAPALSVCLVPSVLGAHEPTCHPWGPTDTQWGCSSLLLCEVWPPPWSAGWELAQDPGLLPQPGDLAWGRMTPASSAFPRSHFLSPLPAAVTKSPQGVSAFENKGRKGSVLWTTSSSKPQTSLEESKRKAPATCWRREKHGGNPTFVSQKSSLP